MMKRTRTYSLLAGSLVALALISVRAHAETPDSEWGDLGYSHPEKSAPEVEAVPSTISDAPAPATHASAITTVAMADAPAPKADPKNEDIDNDEIATTISSAELADSRSSMKTHTPDATDINTIQNTYGVETEERKPITFYAAPIAGISSMLGNSTVNSGTGYSVGVSAGVLIGNNFLVQASYVHAQSNLSDPTVNSTGLFLTDDAFNLKQDTIGVGGRFFILGRDSRVRPFVGGGFNYMRSSLAYGDAYLGTPVIASSSAFTNDMTINQFQGFGEIGAEVAITRNIVATANFQVNGALSSSTPDDSTTDSTRSAVADSIGRTASYMAGIGLGIYF